MPPCRPVSRAECSALAANTSDLENHPFFLSALPGKCILICLTFFDAARFVVLCPNGQVLLSPPADFWRGVAVRPALQVRRLPLLQLEVRRRLRYVGRNHDVEIRRL